MGDPARLEVVRRAKVAKTDPIDARRRVRARVAGALARVRSPTPDAADALRRMRHRERRVRTRVRLHTTIRGLLRRHGIAGLAPGVADVDARLPHPGPHSGPPCRKASAGRSPACGPRGTVVHDPGIRTGGTRDPGIRTPRTPRAGRGIRSPPDSPIPQGVPAACAAQHGPAWLSPAHG